MARPSRQGHLDAAGSEVGEATGFPASDNLKLCDWGGDAATQKRAFDPFYTEAGKHDRRKVGLGLPILKQICEACEGGCSLESAPGVGTTLKYHFNAANIDLPPMGDIAEMVTTLFNYPGAFELVFTHRRGGESYTVARSEHADAVGGLESVEGLSLAQEYLRSQEDALCA